MIYEGSYRDLHVPALAIAGVFVLVALTLSILLILHHLRSYTKPQEQKWIVAVVFMVPVYATDSIISLSNGRFSLECDILRTCYEAFALYCFGSYLVACLGGEERVVAFLEDESRKQLTEPLLGGKNTSLQNRSFANFFCQPNVLGKKLYTTVKFGIVQYMILKTFCAFLAFLLEIFGVYGDGEFKWYYGYPYMTVVLNFSQMWALFCLVQFYNCTHQNLEPIKPLAKFISIKAIVFATWWQGVGIAILCAIGVLPKEGRFQNALQDFLICVEMAVAAVAHIFVFSAKPYRYLAVSQQGEVISHSHATKASIKLENKDAKDKAAAIERVDTHVEAPGTSVTESVQDIVLVGGKRVVKDVVLTINQAIEPVEKGVIKIQEKFHNAAAESDNEEDESPQLQVEEHLEEGGVDGEAKVVSSENKVILDDTNVDDEVCS